MKKSKTLPKIQEVVRLLESKAPSAWAESWDHVGLLVGHANKTFTGALVSTDLTPEVLKRAQKTGANLIINHHPSIFPASKGISRLSYSEDDFRPNALALRAFESGICVYASHSNFDRAAIEVVDTVSGALGFEAVSRLHDRSRMIDGLLKLSVFVPESHIEQVRSGLFSVGAGQIGNYDSCSFASMGEGTFKGSLRTDPFLGKKGEFTKARESRLEVILPREFKSDVLKALRRCHPYEEIAYDLVPVLNSPPEQGIVRGYGYGFIGETIKKKAFSDVLQNVSLMFQCMHFRVTPSIQVGSNSNRGISRIAFCAGTGNAFLSSAQQANCDVFITGDLGFHEAVASARLGCSVIELGHHESERFFAPTVVNWLRSEGFGASAFESELQFVHKT